MLNIKDHAKFMLFLNKELNNQSQQLSLGRICKRA